MTRYVPLLIVAALAVAACSSQKTAEPAAKPQAAAPTTKKAAAKKAAASAAPDLGDVREEHVMIPMRDGAKLSTYIYYPPASAAIKGRFPVIYQQRYVDISSKGQRQTCAQMAAATKCAVALQNFRGAHESEGVFQGYRALGLGELKDGYDTVEWFAKQKWCTGKVGSWGGSQGGYSQNFLAASQPPHLAAQYLTDFGVSLFHDGYRGGGVVRPERFLTKMAIHARDPEQGKAALMEQLKHPAYDDWWKQEDTAPYFTKMTYPSVMLGGWFDPVVKAVIQGWNGREDYFYGQQLLILGPWNHGGSSRGAAKMGELTFPKEALFDVKAHQVKWFGHYLRGEDNHVMDEPRVRYYVMGECGEEGAPGHFWRTDHDFPPEGVKETPEYFTADGKLSAAKPGKDAGSSTYTSDPRNPNKIAGLSYPSATDQRAYEAHGDVLTFTTDALTEPVEWTGLVKAKLWVSSTAKDTDFIVRVTDVYPDGRSILLIDNIRRARFRDGFDKEKPMEPGKVYPVTLDVGYTSMIFNKGHKIRVTIGSTGEDWYEVNPQTGGRFTAELPPPDKMVVAKNTIHHDAEHPSQIVAPIYKP